MFAEDTAVLHMYILLLWLFECESGSCGGGALASEHVVYRQWDALEKEEGWGGGVRWHQRAVTSACTEQTVGGSTLSHQADPSHFGGSKHTL